ncbi:chemokine (C-X-C motif) ligand 12a (stromal cell-derived factor 1) [Aplochiton taeniatus]
MDLKLLSVVVMLAVATYLPFSQAKPISLVERCWCRSVNIIPQRSIRELKFLHTPNCPFQVIAKLKKNNKEVCLDPETKWLQQYLKNALNRVRKSKQPN